VTYNAVEETRRDDPFITETDVIGLYRAEVAVIASRGTISSISDNTHDVPTTDRCRRPTPNDRTEGAPRVQATYDATDETTGNDPFVAEAEAAGLYRPDIAAAASKWTSTIGEPAGTDD